MWLHSDLIMIDILDFRIVPISLGIMVACCVTVFDPFQQYSWPNQQYDGPLSKTSHEKLRPDGPGQNIHVPLSVHCRKRDDAFSYNDAECDLHCPMASMAP